MRDKQAHGFTLVEMAIVLVIIGIILAGVMKGRDIVRGAQVKQFSQQFAQKWATIAQTYYDKTGQQLNDGSLNSGNAAVNGGAADGKMDGSMWQRGLAIVTTLNNVGIEPCTMIKSKLIAPATTLISSGGAVTADSCGTLDLNVYQTTVEGEYAGNSVVTADLVGLIFTVGVDVYNRNALVLYRVPMDVARGLDTAIDGRDDGKNGSCLNMGLSQAGAAGYTVSATATYFSNLSTTTITAKDWQDASDSDFALTTVGILLDY